MKHGEASAICEGEEALFRPRTPHWPEYAREFVVGALDRILPEQRTHDITREASRLPGCEGSTQAEAAPVTLVMSVD
jgi:hypothetical protein